MYGMSAIVSVMIVDCQVSTELNNVLTWQIVGSGMKRSFAKMLIWFWINLLFNPKSHSFGITFMLTFWQFIKEL